METRNQNQIDIKEMFNLLGTKNISTAKYEKLLNGISTYAKSVKEEKFFKALLKEDILKSMNF